MTDLDGLLAAIKAHPLDDTPRLMLADELDERGEWERAEFIRVGCELAQMEADHRRRCVGTITGDMETSSLRCRERELLADRGYGWADGLLGDGWKTDGRSKDGDSVTVRFFRAAESRDDRHWTDEIRLGFHRGFLSRIRCSWSDWSAHGERILADPWVPGLDEVQLTTWPPLEAYEFTIARPDRYQFFIQGSPEKSIAIAVDPFRPPAHDQIRRMVLEDIVPNLLWLRWPKQLVRSWKLPVPEPVYVPDYDVIPAGGIPIR